MPYTLLLADDSVTVQRVIELTFSRENVVVVSVGDGDAAIARIEMDPPDIVLADIGMPGRDGYDVAAFVKGRPDLRRIPVLLLAGAFEPLDTGRAEEAGFAGVLVKPFEPQHVVAQVLELLRGQAQAANKAESEAVVSSFDPPAVVDVLPESRSAPEEALPSVDDAPVSTDLEEERRPSAPALDDYFERLDAALETRGAKPPAEAAVTPDQPEPEDEVVREAVGGAPRGGDPPAVAAMLSTALETAPPLHPPDRGNGRSMEDARALPVEERRVTAPGPGSKGILAEAFSSLLDVEQGKTGAQRPNLGVALWTPMITSAFVDEVTKRVLTRLAPGAVKEVVAQVVSDVADKLVREEMARRR